MAARRKKPRFSVPKVLAKIYCDEDSEDLNDDDTGSEYSPGHDSSDSTSDDSDDSPRSKGNHITGTMRPRPAVQQTENDVAEIMSHDDLQVDNSMADTTRNVDLLPEYDASETIPAVVIANVIINSGANRIDSNHSDNAARTDLGLNVENTGFTTLYTQAESQTQVVEEEPEHEQRKQLTRKRLKDESKWERNVRKLKRTKGAEYKPVRSKTTSRPRSLGVSGCQQCKLKCSTKITEDQRRAVFEEFYQLDSWAEQTIYITNSIQVYTPKRKSGPSRRSNSRAFFLTVKNENSEIETVRVCKRMFMTTLDINSSRINHALTKKTSGTFEDKRGKASPKNKTPAGQIDHVKLHINKFPRYVSHYTRHHSQKEYLRGVSGINDMYRLYQMECEIDDVSPVGNWVYRNIFNTQFNLSFRKPKTDTCKKCDISNLQHAAATSEEEKATIKKEWDDHLQLAEQTRSRLNTDKTQAQRDENILVFSYDLQKTKPLPHLNTNEVYYKRQLSFYNCGIHDFGSNSGYFRMWHEGVASRGPSEIASCLWNWLVSLKTKNRIPKHLIGYADSCGGQNRNIYMALFWQYVLQNLEGCEQVDQLFMVSGHSFLPSDEDFGLDEKEKGKYEQIFTPAEWIAVAKRARKKNKFDVVLMKREDFVDFKLLQQNIVHRKTNTDKEKVEWLQIRWLRFKKCDPDKIYYKYDVEEGDFKCIDIAKRVRGRPLHQLPVLYPAGRQISKAKYNDIMSLMKYVPSVNQGFYKELKHDGQANQTELDDDVVSDGSDSASDEENE